MINFVDNGIYLANMHAACRTQCSEDALRSHLQMAVMRTYELARQRDELERLCNYHEKIHADMLERLAEAPRQRDWQVLETAPRDGTVILLIGRGMRHADGYWEQGAYNGNGAWIWPYVHCNPTHWMPLPKPPKVGAGSTAAPDRAQQSRGNSSHGRCGIPGMLGDHEA